MRKRRRELTTAQLIRAVRTVFDSVTLGVDLVHTLAVGAFEGG